MDNDTKKKVNESTFQHSRSTFHAKATAYAALFCAAAADLYAAVALCLEGKVFKRWLPLSLSLSMATHNMSKSDSAIKLRIIVWPHGESAHGV